MPSSSNEPKGKGKGKRPEDQSEKVAANASTTASKMKASFSASSAELGSDKSTTIAQGGTGKARNSPAITDTLMAKLATTSVSSSQGSSTSSSTQPSQTVSKGARGDKKSALDANSKMSGPSSTFRPDDSSGSAQNKPESKPQNANNNNNEKKDVGDAQSSAEEGEIRDDLNLPKLLTTTTTATVSADLQKKSGASSRSATASTTAAAIARQRTPSVPRTSSSNDDKISNYVSRKPPSERKPLQRLMTTTYTARPGSNAIVSSPTQHDESRGRPSSGSLPSRSGRPDLSKTMSRQVVELARQQPHGGPQPRRPHDREPARSVSPRNEQSSTATTLTLRTRSIPRTNSAAAAAAADDDRKEQRQLDDIPSHHDRDLRDWLQFTGWNDIEYRRGELARQRRLAEIGREKAELEQEAEVAKQARQQHKDVTSTTPSLNESLPPTPRLPDAEGAVGFSRRTEIHRVQPSSFGRLSPSRRDGGVDDDDDETFSPGMLGNYPVKLAAGVKRERRGSDDDGGEPTNKYYRDDEPYHGFDEREENVSRLSTAAVAVAIVVVITQVLDTEAV
ncbi:hypothetical protein SLS53_001571 [Cytospora paraplurivora]|uniref:Uncharacterized protein n=1 Tax=Cytospora paraplurivora TaxID=2898453 RepID=A0AAN9YJE5_9PEZI